MASGPPVACPTASYWQNPPSSLADHRSTPSLPSEAECVIIGSGITGSSIAFKLLQDNPTRGIVMLEARQACSGATGRNGGHCRADRYGHFNKDCHAYGEKEAKKLSWFEEDSVRNLRQFIKDNKVDCDFTDVETVDVFFDGHEWAESVASLKSWREAFADDIQHGRIEDRLIHEAREANEHLQLEKAAGAVSFGGHTLSGYKFSCQLLERMLAHGLNLQTNTEVLSISPLSDSDTATPRWRIETRRGSITTPTVILATNAYTSHLYPPVTDFIIPTRGQMLAQRPGSNMHHHIEALSRSYDFNYTNGNDYMITRPASSAATDVLVGGGRQGAPGLEQPIHDDSSLHPVVSAHLRATLAEHFGSENWGSEGEMLMEWTGIMGYTKDKELVIGEAPNQRGLYICGGYSGHGMALNFQATSAVVEIICGRDDVRLQTWLPEVYRIARIVEKGKLA